MKKIKLKRFVITVVIMLACYLLHRLETMMLMGIELPLTIQGILLTMVDFRTNYAKDIMLVIS